jgi:hypothetical protein
MAETVTIEGQAYLRRNPLGVVGLTIMVLVLMVLLAIANGAAGGSATDPRSPLPAPPRSS